MTRYLASGNQYDPVVTVNPSFADTLAGGRVALERDQADNAVAFASVTRGYKAGGVNVDARIDVASDPLTYATETLWNWEAGLRGHWRDQRVTGEVTAFWLQRAETQVRDSAGFGGNYRFFTDNGGDSHVYGLEAAGAWNFAPGWSARASLALMRSELKPFTLRNGNTGGGRVLANTPEYGYTAGLRYDAGHGPFAQVELAGRGRQFDSNNQHEARRPFRTVGATVGYAWERWSVALWGRNLFDEEYDRRVYFFGNEDPDYTPTRYENRAEPRQLGVTAAYRF
jgi:outer membrane receptor protein involved in Fe transport